MENEGLITKIRLGENLLFFALIEKNAKLLMEGINSIFFEDNTACEVRPFKNIGKAILVLFPVVITLCFIIKLQVYFFNLNIHLIDAEKGMFFKIIKYVSSGMMAAIMFLYVFILAIAILYVMRNEYKGFLTEKNFMLSGIGIIILLAIEGLSYYFLHLSKGYIGSTPGEYSLLDIFILQVLFIAVIVYLVCEIYDFSKSNKSTRTLSECLYVTCLLASIYISIFHYLGPFLTENKSFFDIYAECDQRIKQNLARSAELEFNWDIIV